MWPLCLISTSDAREPYLSRITQNSVCSRFEFGYWLILSKHGTKMANNRHAYNRDVFQSYWTSDGLPLYCSHPTGEKTHTNQQCERLAKIWQTVSGHLGTEHMRHLCTRYWKFRYWIIKIIWLNLKTFLRIFLHVDVVYANFYVVFFNHL